MRQFLFLARRDDAAWQAPCEEEQRCQGQKGACSVHLNLKRFGYILREIEETRGQSRALNRYQEETLDKIRARMQNADDPPSIEELERFKGCALIIM